MKPTDGFPERIGKVAPVALASAGIYTLAQAAQHTEKELLAIHGVGPKGIKIIREELAKRNMSLKAAPSKRSKTN